MLLLEQVYIIKKKGGKKGFFNGGGKKMKKKYTECNGWFYKPFKKFTTCFNVGKKEKLMLSA